MKFQVLSLSLALLFGAGTATLVNAGQYGSTDTSGYATAPDNTGVNVRDHSAMAATADHQSNDKQDVRLASEVRKAIENDASLSTEAKNVKVLTASGHVILRGPVSSAAEKSRIVHDARSVHGVRRITDSLEIAGTSNSR